MVSWKAGSPEGQHGSLEALLFFRLLERKGGPKSAFLKITKENDIRNQLFIKVRHRDPLKTVPGSGFEQHENLCKNNGKINGSWWSKTISFFGKQTLFLILGHSKKRCQKWNTNWSKMATLTSHVGQILWFVWFVVRCQKNTFFRR